MDLLTWNLNGLDDTHLDERTEAALFTILLGGDPETVLLSGAPPREPPAVVLLQEVVARTYTAHVVPHLRAAGYTLIPGEPPDRGYFEVIAVRGIPVTAAESLPFQRTGQGRRLTRVRLGNGWTVCTAHLESLKHGAPVRSEQAARVLDVLRAADGPAVFGGDTNLRDGEWKALESAGITDAWEALGRPAGTRATWGSMRFDRIWLAGRAAATALERVGSAPMASTGTTPSDHLGLRVALVAG